MHSASKSAGCTPEAILVQSRATPSRYSFAEERGPSNLQFTGYLRRKSMRHTRNFARWAPESLSLSRKSPGACVSSPSKISTEIASIFTATEQAQGYRQTVRQRRIRVDQGKAEFLGFLAL